MKTNALLRIVHVNAQDVGGGAERIATLLAQEQRKVGHEVIQVVGRVFHQENALGAMHLREIVPQGFRRRALGRIAESVRARKLRGSSRLSSFLELLAVPGHVSDAREGRDLMRFPETRRFLDHLPWKPQIVHLHNLHSGYFDLQALEEISARFTTVWTLHDEWAFTGHCANSFDCDRWTLGCGVCPDLSRPPSVSRDATNVNWANKQLIYKSVGRRIHVASPSRWLLERAKRSILDAAMLTGQVVPNGVDTSVFCPGDASADRRSLGFLESDAIVIFAAVGGSRNAYKDFATVRQALLALPRLADRRVVAVALGENAPDVEIPAGIIRSCPYVAEDSRMAAFYRSADVFAHAAKGDNFPTTILEALCCGTPVVATAVGGIPEQITDESNGILVPRGDVALFAEALSRVLAHQRHDGDIESARERFSASQMAERYERLYEEAISLSSNGTT